MNLNYFNNNNQQEEVYNKIYKNNKKYINLIFNLNHYSNSPQLITHYRQGPITIIPTELETQYLELYEKFKNNKLKNNTSVYLTQMASLPSYKLKNYIEENKLNITTARKLEKLDTIVISDSFIKKNYLNIKRYDSKKRNWVTSSQEFIIFPISTIIDNPNFKKYIPTSTSYYHNITLITRKVKATHYVVEADSFKDWIAIDPLFKKYPQILY